MNSSENVLSYARVNEYPNMFRKCIGLCHEGYKPERQRRSYSYSHMTLFKVGIEAYRYFYMLYSRNYDGHFCIGDIEETLETRPLGHRGVVSNATPHPYPHVVPGGLI
jgi:hypothetical protein